MLSDPVEWSHLSPSRAMGPGTDLPPPKTSRQDASDCAERPAWHPKATRAAATARRRSSESVGKLRQAAFPSTPLASLQIRSASASTSVGCGARAFAKQSTKKGWKISGTGISVPCPDSQYMEIGLGRAFATGAHPLVQRGPNPRVATATMGRYFPRLLVRQPAKRIVEGLRMMCAIANI